MIEDTHLSSLFLPTIKRGKKDAPKYFTAMKRYLSNEERKLDSSFPQFMSFLQAEYNIKIFKK